MQDTSAASSCLSLTRDTAQVQVTYLLRIPTENAMFRARVNSCMQRTSENRPAKSMQIVTVGLAPCALACTVGTKLRRPPSIGSRVRIMALPAGGSPDAKSKALRVLVIGAGAAGLSVASCLQGAKRRSGAAGFSVAAFLPGKRATQDGTELENIEITVLEARARLGGRICTERFADSSAVDLGAAWLHGTSRSNPLVALAKECGAQLVETDWDNALMFEAVGDEAEPRPSIPIKETEWKRTEKHFESMMQLFYEKQSADRKDAKRGQLTDRSLMQTLRDLKSRKFLGIESLDKRSQLLLLSAIAGETEHDYAATADELSSTWWDIDDEFDGEHALWRDGFVQLGPPQRKEEWCRVYSGPVMQAPVCSP